MGTTTSKQKKPIAKPEVKEKKVYSWEKRKGTDRSNFIVSKKTGERIVKDPGSLNGEQFCIEECTDCEIFAFDHNTNVTIDQCINCKIYIGPCESSVFVRDCKDCSFMIVCQQFRARNLANCQLWLFSATEPVLEISPDLKIGCFNVGYPQLKQHLDKAKLNIWNNRYSEVHNFTPEHPFTILSTQEQFNSQPITRAIFQKQQMETTEMTLPPPPPSTIEERETTLPLSMGITNRGNQSRYVVFVMCQEENSETIKTSCVPAHVGDETEGSISTIGVTEEGVSTSSNRSNMDNSTDKPYFKDYTLKNWMLHVASVLNKERTTEKESNIQLIQSRRAIISDKKHIEQLISLSTDGKLHSVQHINDQTAAAAATTLFEAKEMRIEVIGLEFVGNHNCDSILSDILKEKHIQSSEFKASTASVSGDYMWCLCATSNTQLAVDLFFRDWREKI